MRILIIGDHHPHLRMASELAAAHGSHVTHLDSRIAAFTHLRSGRGADLLLVPVESDVKSLVRELIQERFALPVIAYGIDADATAAVKAIRGGAQEYLPLPPDAELIAAILDAIGQTQSDIIVQDPVMLQILDFARQFAPTEASVLITGESGTGKEVIARYLHSQSRRSRAPMVALNCAAIPEHLLESELFGHEKGAFTGALARRLGKFEEADGGTLMLDEISEMDLRLQAKLLRAVQEREIDRLGGSQPVKVDIRLIATSNRDLETEVRAGRFREDLFFRLNVLTLQLPPLRARRRDISLLAAYFLKKHAAANGLPPLELSPEAMAKLEAHHWPGNVRELENCLHRAAILTDCPLVDADTIVLQGAASPAAQGPDGASDFIGRSMAEVERDLILGTLDHTAGNRTHAARILGISIRTLRNKLKDYTDNACLDQPASPDSPSSADLAARPAALSWPPTTPPAPSTKPLNV
ncbi:MAG: sigma-54 dependent transcriptional regulator [Pseudomonadota bacterium]